MGLKNTKEKPAGLILCWLVSCSKTQHINTVQVVHKIVFLIVLLGFAIACRDKYLYIQTRPET